MLTHNPPCNPTSVGTSGFGDGGLLYLEAGQAGVRGVGGDLKLSSGKGREWRSGDVHVATPPSMVNSSGGVRVATGRSGGGDNGHNLNHLLAHLQPAVAACPGADVDTVVQDNARKTAQELKDRSAIIGGAAAKDLSVVPAWYVLETGKVEYLD